MIIGTNFKLSSAKFLDDRQLCKDYATLIANAEGIIYPPGFEVFCEYENKYYQYVSDTNGGYIWEERKSGVSDGTIGASIKDDTISEDYTWSSAHIDSMRMDLENLITQANDYVDEIDERMLFIEGKFQWFEYFDGSYESLTDKPTIPTKVSELENDSEFIGLERLELERADIDEKLNQKIDAEEDRTLIPVAELERLSTLGNYNDTEIRQLIDELEIQSHTHINSDILDFITEEKINQWDNNTGVDDYNYIQNKPITRVGDDSDILLNFSEIIDEGMYLITAKVGEYKVHNELVHVKWSGDDNVTLTIPNMFMVLNANRTDGVWAIVNELYYGIDRENGKISDTLTIGEDKIILDKEGNGWYGGKVSQEGIPTEDKDLVTKGYVDERFTNYATNERVSAIEKENARRDVIIEALANGRKRTIETDGNDVDLMFSTEKDNVWIDKIEGDTMVNVCDQEEPIAITKSYTVEGTNHVSLQGEYDGKCRPVVQGNTLVNHNVEYDKSIIIGERIDNRQGTEILNFEGTPNCEIKVDIDGHTAINLSTKKEDVLCKSFDSVSGNEINLVAEENSVSDLVIQGNTMVNSANGNYWFAGSADINESTANNGYNFTITSPGSCVVSKGCSALKDNTTYTLIFDVNSNFEGLQYSYYDRSSFTQGITSIIDTSDYSNGYTRVVVTRTTTTNCTDVVIGFHDTVSVDKYLNVKNLMIFEGDLTQTPELIPTEYVEGLKSTFEDKLIPYSIYNRDNLTSITETQYQLPLTVKSNTQYTVTTTANTTKYQYAVYSTDGLTEYLSYDTTVATQTFTCDTSNVYFKVRMNPSYEGDDYSFVLDEVKDKFLIVEGDWSDRLDLLTEEYFGKYRVDMSSHGKNLFNVQTSYTVPNKTCFIHAHPIKSQTSYTISLNYITGSSFSIMLSNIDYRATSNHDIVFSKVVGSSYQYGKELTTQDDNKIIFNSQNYKYLYVSSWVYNGTGLEVANIQLEEGTQATEYEPYYGSTKTVYLNSPLLNGDELLTKDGKLYHYHKMGKVVLDGSEDWEITGGDYFRVCTTLSNLGKSDSVNNCWNNFSNNFISAKDTSYVKNSFYIANINGVTPKLLIYFDESKLSTTDVTGFKQWLSENPTTVVYELAEPWYEPIGVYGKIVLDGSNDENWFAFNKPSETISYAGIQIPSMKVGYTTKIICDKFETLSDGADYDQTYSKEQCYPYQITSSPNVGIIYFHVFNSKLSSPTEEGWKQWLQQNPVTVIYELAEPQYIDEDMRFNIASTSTIEYQSNVPMANTQFLPYRNELPLLESSTQYRVIFDCDAEGLELMVSLGGTSQTITSGLHNELSFITPSLQTDGKLTIDGYGIAKIDNVLITKGDMEYKYFEGLKSGFENDKVNLYDMSKIELDNIDNYQTSFSITNDNHMILKAENWSNWEGFKINDLSNFKENTEYEIVINVYKNELVDNERLYITSTISEGQTDKDIFYTDEDNSINIIPGQLGKFTYYRTSLSDFSNCECVLRTVLNVGSSRCVECTIEIYEVGVCKANIRIQNPNAPIFGKGGRL